MELKLVVIVIATISAGASSGILSGYLTSISQNASFQEEIDILKSQTNELKTQTDIQEKRLLNEEEQTETMRESLEKESLISVKLLPYIDTYMIQSSVSIDSLGGSEYIREQEAMPASISLESGEEYDFDIIITNVGEDTAVVNSYKIEVIRQLDTSGSWSARGYDIKKILKPHDEPLIITHKINVTERDFSPYGDIFFTVIYDNGISEAASIRYLIDD